MHVDSLGCLQRLPLTRGPPGSGPAAASASTAAPPPELLTGVARLLGERRVTLPELVAGYDADGDGALSESELKLLTGDAAGPAAAHCVRYFAVRPPTCAALIGGPKWAVDWLSR